MVADPASDCGSRQNKSDDDPNSQDDIRGRRVDENGGVAGVRLKRPASSKAK
jgi:hypothetical protein